MDFNTMWQLLYDHGASAKKEEGTRRFWETLTDKEQQIAFTTITKKLKEKAFVNFDPIRAIRENIWQARSKPRTETLSFNDYYTRYGTTEERDGWKMENPTGEKVIYVRHG